MSDLLSCYGLKYNPFLNRIPSEDLWAAPGTDIFIDRVKRMSPDGGFATASGDPGLGKSRLLQRLEACLSKLADVRVAVMERPQSTVGDFYRELGDHFGTSLSPTNRYGGFKALRERWRAHQRSTLHRPILLIDEAQELSDAVLSELRLLSSANFDSEYLLTVVLAGDARLPARFRQPALLPLGSRMQVRHVFEPFERTQLRALLDHVLERAGGTQLLTDGLKATLTEHAAGNPRILMHMGNDLLQDGAAKNLPFLDEALFNERFAQPAKRRTKGTSP